MSSKKPGKQTLLNKEEEEALVEALVYLAECGFGLNLIVFKNVVNTYIQKLGIFNIFILKKNFYIVNLFMFSPHFFKGKQFKNGYPSNDWIESFKKRWSSKLSRRKPQKIEQLRAKACNEDIAKHFYETLKEKLIELDIMDKPENIWNSDETGVMCDGSDDPVFCAKGSAPHKITGNNFKEMFTVNVIIIFKY